MKTPWIERIPPETQAEESNGCQVLFAGQVDVQSFDKWGALKWGFNAGALLEEALDRQKLFIESQYNIDQVNRVESTSRRGLALRLVCVPGCGLQVGLLGSISGSTPEQAEKHALDYWRELSSVLPYDYRLAPAASQEDFRRLAGWDLLDRPSEESSLAEIKRAMVQLPAARGALWLPGFWQSGPHSNEQVWRALAAMPRPCLLNISIQPTILFEYDQRILWDIKSEIANAEKDKSLFPPFAAYATWGDAAIKRRLALWKKYYYLQVHIALEGEYDENLARNIATAITRDSGDHLLPGYQILRPASADDSRAWCKRLARLQFMKAQFRLEQLADLEEVYAVFRLPYQVPVDGLPGVKFLAPVDEQN